MRAPGVLAAAALTAALSSCALPAPSVATNSESTPAQAAAPASAAPASAASSALDPGTLPQIRELPRGGDPAFREKTQWLWAAILSGDPTPAHAAFFPLSAYLQVKQLKDPAADYRDRLLTEYDADIEALHARVGAGATLESVTVPDAVARWILPGVESNKGSYWRVYGTRVRYRTAAGVEGTFGLYSLISWRGQWYVVHLGPVTRPAGTGAITP